MLRMQRIGVKIFSELKLAAKANNIDLAEDNLKNYFYLDSPFFQIIVELGKPTKSII